MSHIFRTLLSVGLTLILVVSSAQTSELIILPQIKLPNDSAIKVALLNSLDIFLKEKDEDMYHSRVVEQVHYTKYKDFFDSFKHIERSKKYNDTAFFKPYLTNIVLQPDKSYRVSLAYYGISPDKQVVPRMTASMIAKQEQQLFRFFCPFEDNTKLWKSQKIGHIDFFYEDIFDTKTAKDFDDYNTHLAQKLKVQPFQFSYYKCQDIQHVYRLMGIDFDLTLNGEVRSGSFDAKNKLFIAGTNSEQYKHDLTHGYMGSILSDSVRNWTAEEGYNIYATDYWGESSEQVFKYLKDYADRNPDSSLLEAFEKNITLKFPIPIKYPIAAVMMRKIDKEYGFDKVLSLISCGETDEHFFIRLEAITGITKSRFDKEVRNELKK